MANRIGAVYEVGAMFLRRRRRIRVDGASMQPTLSAGEFVLLAPGRSPVVGDVVVIRHPVAPIRLIKRLVEVSPEEQCRVLSDNVNEGQDSRHFGLVPVANIEGVVTLNLSDPARSLKERR